MAVGTGTLAGGHQSVDVAFFNPLYFTAANTIYSVQITLTGTPETAHSAEDNIISVINVTRAGFRAIRHFNRKGSNPSFTYLAIGY